MSRRSHTGHKMEAKLESEREDHTDLRAEPFFVDVALKLPLRRNFTYRLPTGIEVRIGSRVRVPFRGKERSGIITAVGVECDLDPAKVHEVARILDDRLVLPESLLSLAGVISETYGCSVGEALDAMMPSAAKKRGARTIPHLELAVSPEEAKVKVDELEDRFQARSRLLRTVLEFGAPMPVIQARRRARTSDSPWRTLVKQGLLRRVFVEEEAIPLEPNLDMATERHELNEDQARAVEAVTDAVHEGRHETFLLHGVTGSGKTEVYLRVLEEVRERGRTAIVLVPEIALTPQTVGRFAARFSDIAVLHSGLTEAQRGQQWQELLAGRAAIAIGARSALFAPMDNLGLIVIDEEHENTFKQDSTPRYHAREMAIERARIENAVVLLGSATPTLESYGRARRGTYHLLELPERAGKGTLPKVLVEDLRKEDKGSCFNGVILTNRLRILMAERLKAREQTILFLNRRGYAPVLICPHCGTPVKCPHCDISMCFHARRGRMVCHYCCEERRRPETCDTCEGSGFHELGAGTERVAEVVQRLFPEAIVARMDADTMAERGAHERVLGAFAKGQIDILIGTQMIAKGHDFAGVTLVGVVSADTGLFLPDCRAAERTFQLLYQVAGRSGRAEKPGTVVLQTHCPENYAVRAAADIDYEQFVQLELGYRKQAGYPPYSRLVRVLVEARDRGRALAEVTAVANSLPESRDWNVLGPAPAMVPRIKDRWRHHILVKCFNDDGFREVMAAFGEVEGRSSQTLRITIDVDPGSML